MKKLLFATALVASVAAFADPINAISFEGYTAGATFANGATEKGEDGNNKSVGPFFCYDGDSDGSSVKAFGAEGNASAPSITRPLAFANASPNANYLDLSTEGGILWRSINNISQEQGEGGTTYDLGTPANVTSEGLYLDTLVQFTPTEDGGAPELGPADKLAIWLNVDSTATPSVTNLQVRANLYDFGEAPSATATTFTLVASNNLKTVVAGEWYRLTVKAIPNVMLTDGSGVIPAFEIYIDGVPMYATTAQFTTMMVTTLTGMDELSEDTAAAIAANKLFPSLAEMGAQGSTPTLQGVGFKGSGALDDIVWTTEDPFAGGSSGSDYKVVIDGSDVVVTPTQADLEAIGQALPGLNVTDPTAVNAVLATEIEGSDGIPAWQALFLGVEPTTNGLEQVAIKSISFDENGKVVVEMADAVQLKTERGVYIGLILKGSNDLSTWTTLQTVWDDTEFEPVQPALGETKKFYKVEVVFSGTEPPPPAN